MKFIHPEIFKDLAGISSLFTLANRGVEESGKGLDLGLNTSVSQEVLHTNIDRVSKHSGIELTNIALARQIHGAHVQLITEAGIYADTDGFITATPNVPLAIQVADCAAVLVADPFHRIIGAFHAGWRGAVAGVVPKGIQKMIRNGAKSENMFVYVSACISFESFEVGHEVAKQFPDQFCDYRTYNKPHVDLKEFIRYQVKQSNIPDSQIQISNDCTVRNTQFYSYRRERETAGRMLAILMLNKIPDT